MNKALLLIDIQNDYFPGGRMELNGSSTAVEQARKLLEKFRILKLPIIHIRHISLSPKATFFLPETSGAEIHDVVKPCEGEKIIIKNYPNSFRDTDLKQYLEEKNINQLLICGMMTHMCIDATARAAFDLGYKCQIIQDACATRDLVFNGVTIPAESVHFSFLAALGSVYAEITQSDKIIDRIDI